MKSYIGFCQLNKISLCHRILKVLGCFPEIIKLLLGHARACILDRQIFKCHTDFQYIIQILLCNVRHLCTAARDHHDQTFQFQLTHRLTNRSPADSKFLRQRDLHQSFSGFQLTLQNRFTQCVKYHIS